MSHPRSDAAGSLPRWLIRCGSVAIGLHLGAVAVMALAAPSGPWPSNFGTSMATEPQFAHSINELTHRYFLSPIKMDHNYHFSSNRPSGPSVFAVVRLRDSKGKLLKTVRIPDDSTNFWVRHRQSLLVQALTDDQPVEPRMGETIAAPKQQMQTVTIWDMGEDRVLKLKAMPEHLVPRDRPVFRPSDWSLLLTRSYVRYLCRQYGAATGELIRHSREPIPPAILFTDDMPPGAFEELVSTFGEVSR